MVKKQGIMSPAFWRLRRLPVAREVHLRENLTVSGLSWSPA